MAVTNQEIGILKKMFAKALADVGPVVRAENVPGAHPKAPEIIAAQNVLRDCITVVINECMPIDESFCAELALRLASYAVSVVRIEHQPAVAKLVAEKFEGMHLQRMMKGIGIQSEWVENGVVHSNMPIKGKAN